MQYLKAHRLKNSLGFPSGSDSKGVWFLAWEDTLGKGMTTHYSILACRIPGTEEPGQLQSLVGHNWEHKNTRSKELLNIWNADSTEQPYLATLDGKNRQ